MLAGIGGAIAFKEQRGYGLPVNGDSYTVGRASNGDQEHGNFRFGCVESRLSAFASFHQIRGSIRRYGLVKEALQILRPIYDLAFFDLALTQPSKDNRLMAQLLCAEQLVDGLRTMPRIREFQTFDGQLSGRRCIR